MGGHKTKPLEDQESLPTLIPFRKTHLSAVPVFLRTQTMLVDPPLLPRLTLPPLLPLQVLLPSFPHPSVEVESVPTWIPYHKTKPLEDQESLHTLIPFRKTKPLEDQESLPTLIPFRKT